MPKGTIPNPTEQGSSSYFSPVVDKPPAQPSGPQFPSGPNIGGMQTEQRVGNLPIYYQVKEDDTMDSVSQGTGVPLSDLANLNKTKSLPPSGSYIQLRPEQLINQGVPPSVANRIGIGPKTNINAPNYEGRGDHTQSIRNQAAIIAQQLKNGQLPNAIPSGVLGFIRDSEGNVVTIQDLVAEGYTMNDKGIMVRGGVAGPGNTDYRNTQSYQYSQNVPFLQQKRWDPTTKKYVAIGKLIRQGKLNIRTGRSTKPKKKGNRPAPVAAPVEGTRQGPETALDIHLGSG